MEEELLIAGIADTIQRVYGDATQTALDRRAAEEIWRFLKARGVAPFSTMAAVVVAAGGEITIPENVLVDLPATITRYDQFDGVKLRASV